MLSAASIAIILLHGYSAGQTYVYGSPHDARTDVIYLSIHAFDLTSPLHL